MVLLMRQEAQLMLTNRATRLEVNQGHQTVAFHMLGIVSSCAIVNFVFKMRSFYDIRLQKML